MDFIKTNPEQRKQYLYDNIKSFVKILLYEEINKQVFKIMDEIKITNISVNKKDKIKQKMFETKTIVKFNSDLKQIDKSYKNDFWSKKLLEYIRELSTSPTLNIQELLNLSNTSSNMSNNKIFGNKCLNKNKTDELMNLDMNYRVLDLNGNTILTRLIDQFNIYGITKLIEKNKIILFTYKNNSMETPLDYLVGLIKNIQSDYSDIEFKNRMQKYSISLEDEIKTNGQFDEIELENSSNLVKTIISNSIYLFNSYMWLKNYSYPLGWTVSDKNDLKSILGIKDEILLINSFNSDDLDKYIQNIETGSESKIQSYIKILQDEIAELKNKSKELSMELDNEFIVSQSNYNINDNIKKINDKIKEKEQSITTYENLATGMDKKKYSSASNNIKKILKKYKNKLLDMNDLTIEWIEYNNLLNELDDKYLEIIRILNEKCDKNISINNHLIKIYCLEITNDEYFNLIKKYFKFIYTNTFNDYWDLDRYEDSEYNITNKSIIEIIKINVISVIRNEFVNTLTNYIVQLNKNNSNINDIIHNIKNNVDLKKSIETYLYQCMINKLGLNNPDKSSYELNIDDEKTTIINTMIKMLRYNFNDTEKTQIKKIIDFNRLICENVSLNSYNEIIKILNDGKKISIFYEMYDLIITNVKP